MVHCVARRIMRTIQHYFHRKDGNVGAERGDGREGAAAECHSAVDLVADDHQLVPLRHLQRGGPEYRKVEGKVFFWANGKMRRCRWRRQGNIKRGT